MALAGVRSPQDTSEEKPAESKPQRPAMLLNLFLGGHENEPIWVIEGQAREVGIPARLAGEAVRTIGEPGSGR